MFVILFDVFIEIKEENHHFAGLRGTKIVKKHFVNKLALPSYREEKR